MVKESNTVLISQNICTKKMADGNGGLNGGMEVLTNHITDISIAFRLKHLKLNSDISYFK